MILFLFRNNWKSGCLAMEEMAILRNLALFVKLSQANKIELKNYKSSN